MLNFGQNLQNIIHNLHLNFRRFSSEHVKNETSETNHNKSPNASLVIK